MKVRHGYIVAATASLAMSGSGTLRYVDMTDRWMALLISCKAKWMSSDTAFQQPTISVWETTNRSEKTVTDTIIIFKAKVYSGAMTCPSPMVEWPQIMEGNIAHTLIGRKHSLGCYAIDLQCSLVTDNRVMTIEKVARVLGVKLANSSKKFCIRPCFKAIEEYSFSDPLYSLKSTKMWIFPQYFYWYYCSTHARVKQPQNNNLTTQRIPINWQISIKNQ